MLHSFMGSILFLKYFFKLDNIIYISSLKPIQAFYFIYFSIIEF